MFLLKIKKSIFISLLIVSSIFLSSCELWKSRSLDLSKITTVIIDLDGTIADSFDTHIKYMNELSEEYGYEKITTYCDKRLSISEIVPKLNLRDDQIKEYFTKLKKKLNQDIQNIKVFNGITELLKSLSSRYKVGIITSNLKSNAEPVLKNNNIMQFISFLRSDDEVIGKGKVIRKFLDENNLSNNEVIYIGDEIRDVKKCKKIGIRIISSSWGFDSKQILEKENSGFVVDSPEELKELLLPKIDFAIDHQSSPRLHPTGDPSIQITKHQNA